MLKICTKGSSIKPDRFKDLLGDIVSYMIDNHEYLSISIDKFTEDEVIFKGEAFIKGGIVPKQVVTIGFTFDEYRDYCITNYMVN